MEPAGRVLAARWRRSRWSGSTGRSTVIRSCTGSAPVRAAPLLEEAMARWRPRAELADGTLQLRWRCEGSGRQRRRWSGRAGAGQPDHQRGRARRRTSCRRGSARTMASLRLAVIDSGTGQGGRSHARASTSRAFAAVSGRGATATVCVWSGVSLRPTAARFICADSARGPRRCSSCRCRATEGPCGEPARRGRSPSGSRRWLPLRRRRRSPTATATSVARGFGELRPVVVARADLAAGRRSTRSVAAAS